MSMKEKATMMFHRSASGEVTGEVVNERGKDFGIMTEEEYRRILKLVEQENPDTVIKSIELNRN
jgi:hypothetical protein